MSEMKYKIIKELAVLSTSPKGWTKELNLISWNDKEPKYDLRDWSPEREKIGKGLTFNKNEMQVLFKILKKLFDNQ